MIGPLARPDLALLSAAVGADVVAAERPRWGFSGRAEIVSLSDGSRQVVRWLADDKPLERARAFHEGLAPSLEAAGIPTPRLLRGGHVQGRACLVFEYLDGQPGPELLSDIADAELLGALMGELAVRLARVPLANLRLKRHLSDPERLRGGIRRRAGRARTILDPPLMDRLETALRGAPAGLMGEAPVFAHGDFVPANVLIAGGRVVGLLDLELAGRAHPLADTAWWHWVVRFHHPGVWPAAAGAFDHALGIERLGSTLQRLRLLQILSLLIALDDSRGRGDRTGALEWQRRLSVTLGWADS